MNFRDFREKIVRFRHPEELFNGMDLCILTLIKCEQSSLVIGHSLLTYIVQATVVFFVYDRVWGTMEL